MHTALERGDVVTLGAVLAEKCVPEIGRVDCQTHHAVLGILEIQLEGLDGILILL